ncbi:MAG: hypothetical protein ACRDZ9_05125 [Acidimicrobiales bacterium]
MGGGKLGAGPGGDGVSRLWVLATAVLVATVVTTGTAVVLARSRIEGVARAPTPTPTAVGADPNDGAPSPTSTTVGADDGVASPTSTTVGADDGVPSPTSTTATTAAVPPASAPGGGETAPCRATVGYGQTVRCVISRPGDVRGHRFDGAAGDRILARPVNVEGNLVPGVEVVRPDGSNACPDLNNCVLDTTGRHEVLVGDVTAISLTGEYALALQRLNDPVGCSVTDYGQAAEGAVETPGAIACVVFTASAGDQVRLGVARGATDFRPGINVLRPDGTDACPDLSGCVLDTAGRHTILVTDLGRTRTGRFRVVPFCVAGPCAGG